MRVIVESNYGTATNTNGIGAVCKLVCYSNTDGGNLYGYGTDVELNSPFGFDIRKCGRKEELLEKLNRHKTNYEIRLQNLSSDLFINQEGKTLFANSLRQDVQMFETFIKALEKE